MPGYCFEIFNVFDFFDKTNKANFWEFVRLEHAQVMDIPISGTVNHFLKPENLRKNRYHDVTCWDNSRVVLSSHGSKMYDYGDSDGKKIIVTSQDSDSTYIHASFVNGFKEANKFICCQGPKESTSGDFWKMVSEHNSSVIVSLTETDDEDQVCYEYWVKEEDYELAFGRYVVKTLEIIEESSFTRTRLRLTDVSSDTSREIHHFWYPHWSDYGNPTNPAEILNLISKVNQKRKEMKKTADSQPGPIVVHCSAGIGRTGTFCTIDNALSQLRKEQTVCLPQTVLKIRKQRHSSVFLPEQYAFCYKAVRYALIREIKKKFFY
ncbi:PTP 3 [Bracoviriform demolitoris]|uniref:Tyrosine phosphatase H3 n=1 Tax=Microplitis demolitor bracovirus (isolate Webb) TaxID=654919 RepID=PTPH3_MDBVW|nr:tyrosine-protein phosphatase non-receptor type 9 [Microplitis demolitor]YP_239383.1 PTP 3 [Bracoviriform demolitoris]Q5I145.1 RecName: Full=Tyrosine phosphatase H3; Short=PTP-H3 [Microplitis demolitor bracovirus (isolate Webb)]AAW51787.1 PTP 3 [Bracoviriform demolitoris]KAG6558442.1 protein tyrosine phosphatase H3 [Microplitis demolitor]